MEEKIKWINVYRRLRRGLKNRNKKRQAARNRGRMKDCGS